ncbi:nuclear pore complex NUP50A-like [Olea europaea subsp. europaea]|uniref:Nuclear pore complex NUP50A-like n=1 Tax=Olea europaea subsp. europaea TaxID=158383 RepID=A0A8S0RP03_OLEEU|nr:nuclear pore complex NUP50A-like [Olea europaea subsp. europaea]
MGDEVNSFQTSKKRAAGVQLSRDNPGLDDDEISETETGSFKRASDEVLASRRIVKVRRNQMSTPSVPTSAPSSAPSSNPFAAIRLVTPASAASENAEESGVVSKEAKQIDKENNKSKNKVDEPKDESTGGEGKPDVKNENAKQSESEVEESKVELNTEKVETDDVSELNKTNSALEKAEGEKSSDEDKKSTESLIIENEVGKDAEGEKTDENGTGDKNIATGADSSPFSSFQQLSSSQNAFIGLTGTGFSSSTFSFGSIPKDGPPLGSGSNFGLKNDLPSFGFGASGNGSSSIFGTSGPTIDNKSGGSAFPSMPEVPVETGEENEQVVFTADSVLFEFIDGAWKERGKGELKVNFSTTEIGKARLIMRARGNYRLILNAGLFPDMKLTNMDKKGITFACVNTAGEGKDRLSTFALKFKDATIAKEFRAAVTEHKGKTPVPLKTPENSP